MEIGYWRVSRQSLVPDGDAVAISMDRCPNCCGAHLEQTDCGHPTLTDETRKTALIIVGLEGLGLAIDDPYSYTQEQFPEFEFPGLGGYSPPAEKLGLMIAAADSWWEEALG